MTRSGSVWGPPRFRPFPSYSEAHARNTPPPEEAWGQGAGKRVAGGWAGWLAGWAGWLGWAGLGWLLGWLAGWAGLAGWLAGWLGWAGWAGWAAWVSGQGSLGH